LIKTSEMTQITVAYGVLGEDDLINFFKESFELDYNKQQFIKPTPDFVLSVYLTLIDNFNLNLDLNYLPYLQKVVNVTYCIEELLNKCNIFDFKISDILQPKRKRTQTFVSQLVGIFLDTVEFSNNLLNNQLADEHEVNEAIEIEKTKIERLNNEITKKKQNCHKLKPEIEKCSMRYDELREEMLASRTHSQELSTKGAVLKKEKTQINAVLSTKEYEKLNVVAEVQKLEEDLKLVSGGTIEQAETNKRIANDLRKECVEIQEKCRELLVFKSLKKENLNEFRNEQEEINRNRLVLKENLVEKENFKEKNKICLNEIENLKKKSMELEDEFMKKIKDKEGELKEVQSDLEPVLQFEHVLKRELKKKLSLEREDEHVSQLKDDTLRKQQEIDYYLALRETIAQKFNTLNDDCINRLRQIISN